MKNAIRKAKASGREVKDARPGYTATMTIHAVYRKGRFEPQEPVSALNENQAVELIVRTEVSTESDALPNDLNQRSAQIVQRAKLRAAEQMPRMTADEAQAMYDAAATARRSAPRSP